MRRPWWTTWFLAGLSAVVVGCVSTEQPRPPAISPPGDITHITLAPDDVQRLAVERSALGAALERETAPPANTCLQCLGGGAAGEVGRLLRAYAADEVRNQSAGLALEGYYRLVEARGQLTIARRAKKLAEDLIGQAEELRDKGLKVPEDYPAIQKQRSEQTSKALEFALMRDKLSEQFRMLANPCAPSGIEIQVIETFHIRDDHINEAQAVQTGLKFRADVNLLRTAASRLDSGTLPVIRHVLTSAHGMLASPPRRCFLLVQCLASSIPFLARPEVEKARQQLKLICSERQRVAESEIRSAVREVKTRYELVLLAREREDLARKQLAELEEKEEKGFNVSTELPRARADLLRAEGLALHEIIEWELARVRLRQVQGLLVREVLGGREGK